MYTAMINVLLFLLVLLAKTLAFVSRFSGRGSGTSLPGLIIEKWFRRMLPILAKDLEEVIMISGTNGKTTTRALLVQIYEDNRVKVCTNRGGANILRGLASTLLLNFNWKLKAVAKTAILEVEEATLPILTKFIKPKTIILTNIFRDQLDAYGEIDKTLHYFRESLENCSGGVLPKVYVNGDDQKLLSCLENYEGEIYSFGLDSQLLDKPDYEPAEITNLSFKEKYLAQNIVIRQNFSSFILKLGPQQELGIQSQLVGLYNLYNILAALVVTLPRFGTQVIPSIASFGPVFGRGESITLSNGKQVTLFLVKNPAGFNQVLNFLLKVQQSGGRQLQIYNNHAKGSSHFNKNEGTSGFNLAVLINDKIADGRDVSWLWDTALEDFSQAATLDKIYTGGSRGLDMLLRLEYANQKVSLSNYLKTPEDLLEKIEAQNRDFLVLATYTAMLEFRSSLGKHVKLKNINSSGY